MNEPTEIIAWEVELHGMRCVVFATTKRKAQWIATKSYREAYGRNGWPRAVAFRAPTFDRCVLRHDPPRAYTWDHVYSYPND